MNEPILEALSFALDNDLRLDNRSGPSSGNAAFQPHPQHKDQGQKNSKAVLSSSVILGENYDTPCLIPGCLIIFEPLALKVNKDKFLAHLLTDHKLVIDDVDAIATLHKYVIHWKERFSNAPITDFCVAFTMDMDAFPKPIERKVESEADVDNSSQDNPNVTYYYYMLTPALPEDKELRLKLWNNRLEVILEVNRQEREQEDFSHQCLLCWEIFTGNRITLFEHMKAAHSFHVGKPDNIVFVEEFLELITDKLNKLICLCCEKVFKEKTILREHMRKKGHKRLNSENSEYNRYYIVNYLEPGKDWKALDEEEQEDERVEEEWMEADGEMASIVCLFCSNSTSEFDKILEHMSNEHKFDFSSATVNCDFYQKVKIVNFVRRTVFLNTCLYCDQKFLERTSLLEHILSHKDTDSDATGSFISSQIWNHPEYFFPTYENDQFLTFLDKGNEGEDDGSSVISTEDELVVIPEDLPNINVQQSSQLF